MRIGALTRHVNMLESDLLARTYPDIFREAEAVLADPVVRNRGTMGGSLCQSDPAEDLSGVVVALKGRGRSARPRWRAAHRRDGASSTSART